MSISDERAVVFPDDIARAIALLPWWTGWVGPGFWLVTGAVIGFFVTYVSALAVQPTLTGKEPWHERARLMHPANVAAMFVCWICAGVVAVMLSLDLVANLTLWPIGGISCLLGGFIACVVIGRRVTGRTESWISHLKSSVAAWLLLAPMWLVCVTMSALEPERSLLRAIVIAVAGLLTYELVRHGASVALARFLGLVKPADEQLTADVLEQAAHTGIQVSSVVVVALHQANAFVYPKTKIICFTKGAVDSLSTSELKAIARHELGHCNEPISVQRLRWVRGAMPIVLGLNSVFGEFSWIVLFASLAMYFYLGTRLQGMEYQADAHANDHSDTFANALLALHRYNVMPVVLASKTNTHPELYDRMLACGVTPDFSRPDPPRKTYWISILLAPFMAILSIGIVLGIGEEIVDSLPVELAVFPGNKAEKAVYELGLNAFDAGDYETSTAWISLALKLEPAMEDGPLHLASSFCALERCEDIAKLQEKYEFEPITCIPCSASGAKVLELDGAK